MPYREAYGTSFEDIRRRAPDVTKLRALIGAVPSIGIDQIIGDVLTYWAKRPTEHQSTELSTP